MNFRALIILFSLVLLAGGCTSKRGIIELHTRPDGAMVYLDQTMKGETPLSFEYDITMPITLKIEKEGYYTEIESLCKAWVVREIRKGSYAKGDFTIQGENVKAWKVTTTRTLQKKEEQ